MSPGQSIAHYRITGKLGEGGMGEVYRAADTKLGREVAIKVLPPAFAEDAARMARFEREAQVLAALNHPNIATIYGIEQGAIVMELVEGKDLRGPVSVETALNYALQISAALEAAHEKGIVHRDLKPANIKVTSEGVIKLLDFGLAKPNDEAPPASGTMSPTLSLGMTQAGVIMGTAAYMSPEQAAGKAVDKRADIWSFGVVLFELLSGKQLFEGETVAHTLADVLRAEIDLNQLPAGTPPAIRDIVRGCLERDVKNRTRDIGDVRIAIQRYLREPQVAAASVARPRWGRLAWPVTAISFVILAAILVVFWPRLVNPIAVRFVMSLPEGTIEPFGPNAPEAVPSPDGRSIAFIARSASTNVSYLWLRALESVSAQRLDKTEGASHPFWSPDGRFIGYFADRKVKKIALTGGSPQTISEFGPTFTGSGDGATWNREGVVLFSSGLGPLQQASAAGGSATPATKLDTSRKEIAHSWPQFLPDGRHVLYLARSTEPDKTGIYVEELGSGKPTLVLSNATRAAYAPPGYLLFAREGALFAQRLNVKTFGLQAAPVPIGQEISVNEIIGRAAFAVSENGILVYRGGSAKRQLIWYDREGKRLSPVGEPGDYVGIRLAPDEKRAIVSRNQTSDSRLWVMDLGTGLIKRASSESGFFNPYAAWSPDSAQIAAGPSDKGILSINIASGATAVLSPVPDFRVVDWSKDGRFLLGLSVDYHRVLLLNLGDGKLQTLYDTPYPKVNMELSPDGNGVLYGSDELGQAEVFVASFPSFQERKRLSPGGGTQALWGKTGTEAFYRASNGALMAVPVKTGAKIEVGIPTELFKTNTGAGPTRFAVSRDGKRFLVNEDLLNDSSSNLTVVLNWTADLKQ